MAKRKATVGGSLFDSLLSEVNNDYAGVIADGTTAMFLDGPIRVAWH